MAEIFVSYTSKDRDWAFWIGQELEKLGHVAHIDEWEISGGGDIAAWMDESGMTKPTTFYASSAKPYLEQTVFRAGNDVQLNGRPHRCVPILYFR